MGGYEIDDQGHWLSQDHLRIAEIIHDYNPTLRLAWIPPENRLVDDTELPFAVMCDPANGAPSYVVFQLREDEVDHRVLERIFESDTHRTDVLSRLERQETARQLIKMKEEMDRRDEAREFAHSVFKSPKSTYKHNGVTYH
jgi:hypothetical protein